MDKKAASDKFAMDPQDRQLLERILVRAQALAMNMIYVANHREGIEKGDPKVGGHPSASSSALHVLGALHLLIRSPEDFVVNKPHASPTDHALQYLLKLFREKDGSRMSDERSQIAMKNLRHFPQGDEPVFQSYHSVFDPDHWGFLPSGSVGIPPVQALYLAKAFDMTQKHKRFESPERPHFWCLMGDSEFREGSLLEALPEGSERDLDNLTWIIDYNRQSLDGNRTFYEDELGQKDSERIADTAQANGWEVFQMKHGRFREGLFKKLKHGEMLKEILEYAMPDSELQALLQVKDAQEIIQAFDRYDKKAAQDLATLKEEEVHRFIQDLGGHDLDVIFETLSKAKKHRETPTLIISHSIKGWNLNCAATPSNHSAMMDKKEVIELLGSSGVSKPEDLYQFERFKKNSPEDNWLKKRGEWLYTGIEKLEALRDRNKEKFTQELTQSKWFEQNPTELGINLKLLPWAHTQWMLGQWTAKVNRIGDSSDETNADSKQKALTEDEKRWKPLAQQIITLAPDVGTSTNLNASMDGKTFGPESEEDFEKLYQVLDKKNPDIKPSESASARHIRFEIAEANAMSCLASFGKWGSYFGTPFFPLMTVYDFFVKRALDQLFYGCYWDAPFVLMGTPSGISLSPEGAQHCWKSDIQIANLITWEPTFALELDWILTESFSRHINHFCFGPDHERSSKGRTGVLIRAVTRALEQKTLLKRLKEHKRFAGLDDAAILEETRKDCLEGAWYLVDYRGYDHYQPGENVLNIFAMGCLAPEALAASDKLKEQGIFANVIQVSSPDLLVGNLAEENNFRHLREKLQVNGDLYLGKAVQTEKLSYPPKQFGPSLKEQAQFMALGGRRVPIVSVHDGEPGLLDNIGSCVGTLHKSLAVRKHSKSGTPRDVYAYHGLDADSIFRAAQDVLQESSLCEVRIDPSLLSQLQGQ